MNEAITGSSGQHHKVVEREGETERQREVNDRDQDHVKGTRNVTNLRGKKKPEKCHKRNWKLYRSKS